MEWYGCLNVIFIYKEPSFYSCLIYAFLLWCLMAFTPLLDLHPLTFGLMPFALLHTMMLARVYYPPGAEQGWEAVCLLETASVTMLSLFSSNCYFVVHWFTFIEIFFSSSATLLLAVHMHRNVQMQDKPRALYVHFVIMQKRSDEVLIQEFPLLWL